MRIASTNAALGGNIQELLDTPIRTGGGPAVYLRDIGTIQDSTDIIVGYAHVNGRRTVYIPVTKRADASTLAVIERVREALPRMRAVAPRGRQDRPGVRPVGLRGERHPRRWSAKDCWARC